MSEDEVKPGADDPFDDLVLDAIVCPSCGTRFGLSRTLLNLRKNDHQTLWCPNGHSLSYPKKPPSRDEELETARSAVKLAQDELAAARAEVDQLRAARRGRRRRSQDL